MISSVTTLKAIASILSIATITNAHMIMSKPIPYGRGSIDNSPLAADGSNYPCKSIFDMTDPVADVNHLVPGVPNTLSFTGGATHGGGSCQVSLTNDLRPTKNSKWMVIKSIEGGCPTSEVGNIGTSATTPDPTTFQYTVPEGFPEGQYTIAWTWFNKVGNREMYMNCGRANIANSKKRYAPPAPKIEHRAADYPDIFKANLAIFSGCMVLEGTDVKFPNGGPDVQVVKTPSPPQGCGGSSDASSPNPVSGGSPSSAVSSSAIAGATASRVVGSSAASASGPAQTGGFAHGSNPTSSPTAVPGNFAPSASSSSAAAVNTPQASASVVPIPQQSASAIVPAQPTPSSSFGGSTGSPATSTGATTAGTKCSEEGAWACSSDGTSFQRCASGLWSASMKVAAGTACTPGQSMNLSMKVVSGGFKKRSFSQRRSEQISE